jgi:hypothetical protein
VNKIICDRCGADAAGQPQILGAYQHFCKACFGLFVEFMLAGDGPFAQADRELGYGGG